ncbi:MAG: ATP-binding protein [Ghiorsea sp.]
MIQPENEFLQIRLEQIRLLYRPTISVAIAYGLGALFLAFVLLEVIDQTVLLIWLVCMGLVITGRVLSFVAFQRKKTELHEIRGWENIFLNGVIISGVTWGAAGIFLFPHGVPEYQALIFLVLTALCSGAVTTLSGLRKPIFIFFPLVLIPITVSLLLEPSNISNMIGVGTVVVTLFLMTSARQNYLNHLENITLRIESVNREAHIRKTEKRLLQAQRIAKMGSWQWNIETESIYWSDETYRIFGLQPGSIEPSFERYIEYVHPDDRETIKLAVKEAIEAHAPFHVSHRILLADGSERVVNEEGEVHLNDEGKAVLMSGIIHDVTEHIKLEEQLQQSQKMEAVGTLVGGIAHDFNNILAGMTGNLYLAKKYTGEPDVQTKLMKVEQLALRAAGLIKQLMTFARKDRVSMKPLPLEPFTEEVLGFLRSSVPENIAIYQTVCSDSLQINGDETQLHQVLMNLVNNARDAVEGVENGSISVKLESFTTDDVFLENHVYFKAGTYAHLSVTDNGCGISTNQVNHIFEPFFTTKEQGKGTGLGLSMVFGAIKTHQGYVEVESVENKGTTFHVYIPLLQAQSIIQTEITEAVEAKGQGELVLLVDDEAQILETGNEVLTSLGYCVLKASDGKEAVEIFNANKDDIAIIIMDIVMPVLGGVKAVERIKEIQPDTKVIFSTGYDMGADFPDVMPSNKAMILTKPYDVNELNKIIRKKLDS